MTSESTINPRSSLATRSLVLGILSFAPLAGAILITTTGDGNFFMWLANFGPLSIGIDVALAIAAIITGAVSPKPDGKRKNSSVAGIALGALTVGAVLLVIWMILVEASHFHIGIQ